MNILDNLPLLSENMQNIYDIFVDIADVIREATNTANKIIPTELPTLISGVANGAVLNFNADTSKETLRSYIDTRETPISSGQFEGYSKLYNVQIKAKQIGARAFKDCNIHVISLYGAEESAFSGCPIESINVLYDSEYNIFGDYCFSYNSFAQKIHFYIDNTACVIGAYLFYNCTNLVEVSFPFYGIVGKDMVVNCPNLKAICFRRNASNSVESLGMIHEEANIPETCYIYVPSKRLSAAKEYWPVYANRIRSLEDYTVDGTINGNLNYDII